MTYGLSFKAILLLVREVKREVYSLFILMHLINAYYIIRYAIFRGDNFLIDS